MLDDDAKFLKHRVAPLLGSSAFADAVLANSCGKKRGKDVSKPSGSRLASSYTVCYYYGNKGHYTQKCKHAKS